MRLIVVRSDNRVTINGESRDVDCSVIDPSIHAVQWYDTHGEIEYMVPRRNVQITDITQFQVLIDAWNVAKPNTQVTP